MEEQKFNQNKSKTFSLPDLLCTCAMENGNEFVSWMCPPLLINCKIIENARFANSIFFLFHFHLNAAQLLSILLLFFFFNSIFVSFSFSISLWKINLIHLQKCTLFCPFELQGTICWTL